jgi:luciferase-type oxidoreductase
MFSTPGHLTLGIVLPIQTKEGGDLDYGTQIDIARKADKLGFSAIWVRDVPLNSESYPDPIGHSDPWVLLGALAHATSGIKLVTGSIVLPLRHPLHIAKAALSVNALSQGRFVLGLGSGDRPSEFAVFGKDFESRKKLFRHNWARLAAALGPDREVVGEDGVIRPEFQIRPREWDAQVPMLAVGSASQSLEWIARNAVGWATYYRPLAAQADRIGLWRTAVAKVSTDFRSFSQSMVLDLSENPNAPTEPLGLGMRTGRSALIRYLRDIGELGANHVMFNLVAGRRPAGEILQEIAEDIVDEIGKAKEAGR